MPCADERIGPYTLIRKIGRGAFGEVWLAERPTSLATTTVALKLPLNDEIDLELVKREASLWVQASGHSNVLSLIEADVYEGQVIFAAGTPPGQVPMGALAESLTQNSN